MYVGGNEKWRERMKAVRVWSGETSCDHGCVLSKLPARVHRRLWETRVFYGWYCFSFYFGFSLLPTLSFHCRIRQASSQPRREYQPKPRMSLEFPTGDSTQPNGGLSHTGTPKPAGKGLRPADFIAGTFGESDATFPEILGVVKFSCVRNTP